MKEKIEHVKPMEMKEIIQVKFFLDSNKELIESNVNVFLRNVDAVSVQMNCDNDGFFSVMVAYRTKVPLKNESKNTDNSP